MATASGRRTVTQWLAAPDAERRVRDRPRATRAIDRFVGHPRTL